MTVTELIAALRELEPVYGSAPVVLYYSTNWSPPQPDYTEFDELRVRSAVRLSDGEPSFRQAAESPDSQRVVLLR